MPNLNMELAISTSIIVGLILAFFNIGGIFALVFVGFLAVFLINEEDASYKVGALAAALLCLIYFVICLFTPPDLPYQLPSPLVIGLGYGFEGLFTLVLGLIVGLLIYGLMGAIGGYFADKLFKPQHKPKRPKTRKRAKKIVKRNSKPQRRTLNRKYG
jgi:amino acid transporter